MAQHTFDRIAPHVFWLSPDSRTDRPVLGAITGTYGILLVDAGNSPAHAELLLEAVEDIAATPPAYVALTHWHWDHVFGTSALLLPTFAHVETRRVVADMARLDWSDAALDRRVEEGVEIAFCADMIKAELPERTNLALRVPDIVFTDQVTVDLGSITCQIVHVGGDHASDACIVYVPEERIMFWGDCLYPDIYTPVRRFTVARLFPLIDRLLSYDVDYYLEGHNPAPVPRAEMLAYTASLNMIGRIVEEHGDDRAAILADVERRVGGPADEDTLDTVDLFLAGLGGAKHGSCSE